MFVVWETFALCNGSHHLSTLCKVPSSQHCTAHCQVHTAHCARVLPWESSITAQEPLWPCTHSTGQSLHLLTSSSSPSSLSPSSSPSSPSSSHWWNIMSQLVLADCLPHRRHLHAWTRKPTHCFLRIIVLVMSSHSQSSHLSWSWSWYISSQYYDTSHHIVMIPIIM